MRVSGALLRRGGLGTVLLGAVVALAISTSAGTAAGWSGTATLPTQTLQAGAVRVTVGGLDSLTTTFSSSVLTTTGAVTFTNSGDATATLSTATTLSAASSSALAGAISLTVWPTADATTCAATTNPTSPWTGSWSALTFPAATLAPGRSVTSCVRAHVASSALTTTASVVPTITATLTTVKGAWTGSGSASTTQRVVGDAAALSPYARAVLAAGAADYWRLGEPSGSAVYDWAGSSDAVAGTGVTRGSTGAIAADSNAASTFSGASTAFAATQVPAPAPNTFTVEAWFRTTTTGGGKIVGFGNSTTGNSSAYDRHVYMDPGGRVAFGTWHGAMQVVSSTAAYNDGEWHYVVASLSPTTGLQLSIDDVTVGTLTSATVADPYNGYWRIGGDSSWSGSNDFSGAVDDVAVYGSVLSTDTIGQHFSLSGYNPASATADPYASTVYRDDPLLYWRLGESSGTTAADAGKNGYGGVYSASVTPGARGALAGTTDTAATFNGTDGQVASTRSFVNPQRFTLELWFKTTTTRGGTLIGFGDKQTGTSSNYDRLIYMQNDGRLAFGTYSGGTQTAVSPSAYNDGQWHAAVATQSSAGMVLYVDGRSVATNGTTSAQNYTGYWRVGGDRQWAATSDYLQGTIDDVAVYGVPLTAAQAQAHFTVGAKTGPVAAFTSSAAYLSATFDGSGSSDASGTIGSYAWDFGDGSTGSGRTTTHGYADAGTYTVKLSVTDDDGSVRSVSHTVTVAADPATLTRPGAPVASDLTSTSVTLTWRASSDTAGVASYQVLRNGALVQTVPSPGFTDTGLSPTTSYTYTVTATDNAGAVSSASPATTITTPVDSQGTYQVQSTNFGALCIDRGAAPQSGTALTMQSCTTPATQGWQFAPTDSGYSTVTSPGSPLVWDVVGGPGVTSAALIDVATGTGATSQQWQAVPLSSSTYKLVVRSSGLCIDIVSNSITAGAQLQQYTCNGTAAQAFTLVKQ